MEDAIHFNGLFIFLSILILLFCAFCLFIFITFKNKKIDNFEITKHKKMMVQFGF